MKIPGEVLTQNTVDFDDEALAIMQRRRPDLAGKTLEECRAILRAKFPGKCARRPVGPSATRRV